MKSPPILSCPTIPCQTYICSPWSEEFGNSLVWILHLKYIINFIRKPKWKGKKGLKKKQHDKKQIL